NARGFRECREGESVPRRELLVIEPGPYPLPASRQQLRTDGRDLRRKFVFRDAELLGDHLRLRGSSEHIAAGQLRVVGVREVPLGRYAEPTTGELRIGAGGSLNLRRRPDEVLPLNPFAVRILRRIESPLGVEHLSFR